MFHNLTIDNLMPAKNTVNYSAGKLDISCISRDKFINDVPEKEFDSDVLLKNITENIISTNSKKNDETKEQQDSNDNDFDPSGGVCKRIPGSKCLSCSS